MIPAKLAKQLELLAAARRQTDDAWALPNTFDASELRNTCAWTERKRVTRLLEAYGEILAEEEK